MIGLKLKLSKTHKVHDLICLSSWSSIEATPVKLAPFHATGTPNTPECRHDFPQPLCAFPKYHSSFPPLLSSIPSTTPIQKLQFSDTELSWVRYSFVQASFSQLRIIEQLRAESQKVNMPSAKGKPTDPKLKEKVTEGMYLFLTISRIAIAIDSFKFVRMSIDTIRRSQATTQ